MALDWRVLVATHVIASGVWGFALKLVLKHVEWKTAMFYVWTTIFVGFSLFVFRGAKLGWTQHHRLAILTGLIAAVGTAAFYKALSLKPASVVVPLSAQYVAITSLLSWAFLDEPMTPRIVAGLTLSIASVILLGR